ncbi:HD-GYP domain-containing protein [Rubeoparvulum massiliense]|uniref:HD-GYP domain-containing protein n=1 Tax=Rubeoparvulum massiliense TaxID=1631346 RepID=UPI00065E2A69|nr:HD-GYP domain-containing protein [Rubeoparvulum massiliense]
MRLVSIQHCVPGMILAKDIYDESGVILIAKGMELTPRFIRRMSQMGVTHLFVIDDATEGIEPLETVSLEVRKEVMSAIHDSLDSLLIEEPWRNKVQRPAELHKRLLQSVHLIIDELKTQPTTLLMLGNIYVTDHELYKHSYQVMLYSLALGFRMGYNDQELAEQGLGAIFHDVGKQMIPSEILNKPGKLTEEEFQLVQQHTWTGFQILRKQPELSLLVAHCALQHHERIDGSGYPRQLLEEDIQPYAQVVAIADVYDALTSNRVYRGAMLPHEAYEILLAGSGKLFNPKMIEVFHKTISMYPIGMSVRLSTGELGVVVDVHSNIPERPVIRVLYDANGEPYCKICERDLSKQLHVMIEEVDVPLPFSN